jgi:hypothetical protein
MDELDVLQKKIRERMNDIADAISTGSCKNYDQYQRLCGIIEGLASAERDLLDIAERRND